VTYGGDLGNKIFVLYWRCPLIRVSVIRGSTGFYYYRINGTIFGIKVIEYKMCV
jgi:hypothetical protein